MKFRKLLTTVFAVISMMVMSTAAFAGPVKKIGGGGADAQYIKIVRAMAEEAGKLLKCEGVVSKGSGDNMAKLTTGDLDFGLSMGPVEEQERKTNSEYANSTVVIRYIAYEALFAYTTLDYFNDFVNWEGIKANGDLAMFSVPNEKSGDFLIFKQLQVGNDLNDALVTSYGSRSDQVMAVVEDEANLGFAAQFPNPKNSFFTTLKKYKLQIMPVMDMDLALESDLYDVREVPVAAKWRFRSQVIETMVCPIAVIARLPEMYSGRDKKIQEKLIAKFRKANEADLLPKEGFFSKMVGDRVAKSAEYLKNKKAELLAKAKEVTIGK